MKLIIIDGSSHVPDYIFLWTLWNTWQIISTFSSMDSIEEEKNSLIHTFQSTIKNKFTDNGY